MWLIKSSIKQSEELIPDLEQKCCATATEGSCDRNVKDLNLNLDLDSWEKSVVT